MVKQYGSAAAGVLAVIRASRPCFRNDFDKVAFVLHASFLCHGYALTATGRTVFTTTSLSSTSTDEVAVDNWNELDSEYGFIYVNPECISKKVLVKAFAIHDKLIIDVLGESFTEPAHLEIQASDYSAEGNNNNYGSQFKNIDGLVDIVNSEILSRLDHFLCSPSASGEPSRMPYPPINPIGSEDSLFPSDLRTPYPPVNPVGSDGLLLPSDLRFYPSRGEPGSGHSEFLGPKDPIWFGRIESGPRNGGIQDIGVPPGARFDPYGPPSVPGFEPDRFSRNPRRPGSGIHPDLQQFGSGSDFI